VLRIFPSSPLQPKGPRFDHFCDFLISFQDEMDEKKKGNYLSYNSPQSNFAK
jgi:hypothetical protein